MNIYIDIGKFNKNDKEKNLCTYVTSGDIDSSILSSFIRNHKQKEKIIDALNEFIEVLKEVELYDYRD